MLNGEIIKEIERNFNEIKNAPKKEIPLLLNTIIRQIGRLNITNKEKELGLTQTILNLKNIMISEKAFAELQKKNGGEEGAYGESFLKSLFMLKEDLFNLLSEIS